MYSAEDAKNCCDFYLTLLLSEKLESISNRITAAAVADLFIRIFSLSLQRKMQPRHMKRHKLFNQKKNKSDAQKSGK